MISRATIRMVAAGKVPRGRLTASVGDGKAPRVRRSMPKIPRNPVSSILKHCDARNSSPKVPSLSRSFSRMRLETEGEEVGKLVPMSLKAVYSSHHEFSKGEFVVVNHKDGQHFFGRVHSDTPQKNQDNLDGYLVVVDDNGSIQLISTAEIGKIVSTGEGVHKEREPTYHPPRKMQGAHVQNLMEYNRLYHESLENPDAFWSGISENFHWHKKWHTLSKVGYPHKVKGESIYAFVTLKDGQALTPEIEKQLKMVVRAEIGPFAAPEIVHGAPSLPKTRSGKLMRRILRRIAATGTETKIGDLGDLSTLSDPSVVQDLIDGSAQARHQ